MYPQQQQATITLGTAFSEYRHLNITQAEFFYEGSGGKYFVEEPWALVDTMVTETGAGAMVDVIVGR